MKQYSKFLVAAIAVVLTGLNAVYGNNSAVELLITVAAALGVYHIPNA